MRELFTQWRRMDEPAIVTYADEPWQWITTTPTNGRVYLKGLDVARPYASSATYWVMTDHSQDRSVRYRTSFAYVQFNCTARSVRELQASVVYPDQTSVPTRASGFAYAAPGSVDEIVLNKVCERD